MVTSSGYFVPPEPQAATPGEDLELMYESKDGPCQLLKGHKNDRIVVYKVLKPAFRDEPVYQRLLRREYEIGASLTHPGVCQTLGWTQLPEYGEAIEMEWIGGVRLDRWLQEHRGEKARQRRILMDICDALSYLHRKQVVHKDLKPENILVTRYGDYPKIIDFGLSDTDSILTGKEPGGTLLYAAPEVVAGGEADALSDIYSLGRIMQGMGRRIIHPDESDPPVPARDVGRGPFSPPQDFRHDQGESLQDGTYFKLVPDFQLGVFRRQHEETAAALETQGDDTVGPPADLEDISDLQGFRVQPLRIEIAGGCPAGSVQVLPIRPEIPVSRITGQRIQGGNARLHLHPHIAPQTLQRRG